MLNQVALARTIRENPEIENSTVARIVVSYLRHDDISLQEQKHLEADRLGDEDARASLPRLRRRRTEADVYEADLRPDVA